MKRILSVGGIRSPSSPVTTTDLERHFILPMTTTNTTTTSPLMKQQQLQQQQQHNHNIYFTHKPFIIASAIVGILLLTALLWVNNVMLNQPMNYGYEASIRNIYNEAAAVIGAGGTGSSATATGNPDSNGHAPIVIPTNTPPSPPPQPRHSQPTGTAGATDQQQQALNNNNHHILNDLTDEEKAQIFQTAIEMFQIRFPVVGDQGRNGEFGQREVAKQMDKMCSSDYGLPCPFFLSTGDNFYPVGLSSVDDPQFEQSFDKVYDGEALKKIPFFTVLGNHDYYTQPQIQTQMSKIKGLTSTSTNRGRFYIDDKRYYFVDVHLIASRDKPADVELMIDVNGAFMIGGTQNPSPKSHLMYHLARLVFIDTVPMLGSNQRDVVTKQRLQASDVISQNATRQIEWLEQTLKSAPNSRWKMVIGHHPIYSFGWHGDTEEIASLKTMFQKNGVAAYITGHDHILQHVLDNSEDANQTELVNHFISGAGSKVDGDNVPKKPDGNKNFAKRFYYSATSGFMMMGLDHHRMYADFRDWNGHLLYNTVVPKSQIKK